MNISLHSTKPISTGSPPNLLPAANANVAEELLPSESFTFSSSSPNDNHSALQKSIGRAGVVAGLGTLAYLSSHIPGPVGLAGTVGATAITGAAAGAGVGLGIELLSKEDNGHLLGQGARLGGALGLSGGLLSVAHTAGGAPVAVVVATGLVLVGVGAWMHAQMP